MNLGLEWINELMAWLVSWLPTMDICECTHEGVKVQSPLWRGGVRVKRITPGRYWYWPRTTKVYTTATVRQPLDLPSQSVATLDGVSILFSVSLVYRVTDVEKVLTKIEDFEAIVTEFGAAAAVDCVACRAWDLLRTDFASGTVEQELLDAIKKALRKYGVTIEEARLTDLAKHTAIRVAGTGTYLPPTKDDEE